MRRGKVHAQQNPGWGVGQGMLDKIDTLYFFHRLNRMENFLMALSDDLKVILDELTAEVNRIGGEIDQLLIRIGTPGVPEAEVQAAVDKVRVLVAQLKAKSDESDAKVP